MSFEYAAWHLRSLNKHQKHSGFVPRGSFSFQHATTPSREHNPKSRSDEGGHRDYFTTRAVDLFCSPDKGAVTRRTGTVDGEEITFELQMEVTKERPKTGREERQKRKMTLLNADRSRWDLRARWWLMKYRVASLTLMYVATYLALNFVFAGLWMIQEGKCCDDSGLAYTEIFDFAIQTSSTIGYGGYVPDGHFSNFLVVVITIMTFVLNSIYAGVVVMKFLAPSAAIKFSEVMTLSNVNGVPCLELRVGNADGNDNPLLNVEVRMQYSFILEYSDEKGEKRSLGQTEDLKLLVDKRAVLDSYVWTLRHMVDENSPLHGLDFFSPPGSHIIDFHVALQATQEATGAMIFAHSGYQVEDVMIGHRFVDQIEYDKQTRVGTCDYAKLSETVPQHIWYPVKSRL